MREYALMEIPGFRGRVTTAQDSGWDTARQAFNLAVNQQPAAVVHPTDVRDVVALVGFAAESGLYLAPQTTGHNAGPLDLEDTLLVKTTELGSVEIDADARRARVGAGVLWAQVVEAAGRHGLAALHGASGTVGVAGYSLGGGLGWYGRKHGLQSNALTAVELVGADGAELRVDADSDPELFWALRGGGGNFGVVTALEFELFEIAEAFAGMTIFPWERSLDLLGEWHQQTASWPEELTSSLRILQVPDLPTTPDPLRGGKFVVVDGAFLGSADEGAELIAPLRAIGDPVLDTWATVPAPALQFLHMDPPEPGPAISDSRLVDRLDEHALEGLVALAGPESGSPMSVVELRHIGGALSRAPEGAGAVGRLEGEFVYFSVGVPMTPELGDAIRAHLPKLDGVVSQHATGRSLNFAEWKIELEEAFDGATLERLRAVRAAHDPASLLRASHQIAAA